AGVFHLPGGHSDIYLKTHNENDNTWGDFIYEVTTPLILGRGYECWVGNATFSQDETIEFEGALNAGDYTTGSGNFYDLEYTPDHGLNLISNPYPSALEANINTTAWAKTNIVNSVWTWDGTAGNYVYWNGTDGTNGSGWGTLTGGVIPSMQAFFVLANGSNPSLTIPQSSRVHSSQAYYKGTSGIPNTIRLDIEGNGYKDAMFVSFNELATDEYEGEYDVKKIYGLDQAPQLYSIIPGEILSINSLSELNEYRIVNLGFECGVPAIFTIEASEIESFKENITIYLEDIKEGTMFNLSENPSYTFNYETGDDTNRFLLHFGEPNSINEPGQQNIRIYSNENIIYIQQPAGLQGEIVIFNILGQEIKREKVNNEELTRIRVTNGTGYYIVKVKTGKQLLTQKV
ncbi:MAG: T9SS type A sorting domain-containing protein, partial [Bacteroidales bacterium]|nr:T9SS type A sorting domain-containing protein [Bacteroidales bacterium]